MLAEKVLLCPCAKVCGLIPCVLDAGHLRSWCCREGMRAAFCCPVGFICPVVFLSNIVRCFAHSRTSYLYAFHPPSSGTAGHRIFQQLETLQVHSRTSTFQGRSVARQDCKLFGMKRKASKTVEKGDVDKDGQEESNTEEVSKENSGKMTLTDKTKATKNNGSNT